MQQYSQTRTATVLLQLNGSSPALTSSLLHSAESVEAQNFASMSVKFHLKI